MKAPNHVLHVLLGTAILLVSCAQKSERAVLRVEFNARAWREYTSPPGTYGLWDPPILVLRDSTRFKVYTNALRAGFQRADMDPNTKVEFHWEERNVTNVILFLSTRHPEPHRVMQVASNAFLLWLNERPFSNTMRVCAP